MTRRCPVGPDVRLGPGDDAAWLATGQVVSVDTLVQGVHFDARLSWQDVGYKAVAVSISDIAAMGATPAWMVVSLSLPRGFAHIEALAEGIGEACTQYRVTLAGGDTTRSPGPVVVSVTLAGNTEAPVLRSGAIAGHDLWVSGHPGLAGAGYLLAEPPAAALAALRRPRPPVALATALANAGIPSAMMDVSDGIAADAARLARASHVGLRLEPERFPVHPALHGYDVVDLAMRGGDDYQLLFTAGEEHTDHIVSLAHEHGIPLTRIGEATATGQTELVGHDWPQPAFEHFAAGDA